MKNEKIKVLQHNTHISQFTSYNSKGITLVALVVTIVVLLILAGTSIISLMGDNGIIAKAQEVANATKKTQTITSIQLDILVAQLEGSITQAKLEEILANYGTVQYSIEDGSITGLKVDGLTDTIQIEELYSGKIKTTKVADNIGEVISKTENTNLTDSYGNKITIPAGFFIVQNGKDNVEYSYDKVDGISTKIPVVQDGIVIQNATDENQFVWVPVGNIKNDAAENTANTTLITLGRYSNFTVTNGVLPTPTQIASETDYNTVEVIEDYYFEISNTFAGGESGAMYYEAASFYENAKATGLKEWITTTISNGGYYIARYEASQSASDITKAASKSSQIVWVDITQTEAADAAKATYSVTGANKNNYYSDLVNSYAWDTAIVFIEAYADNSYGTSENNGSAFTTTGTNGDQKCNINDMLGNASEWTTETSAFSNSDTYFPCTKRGGWYDNLAGMAYGYASSRYYFMTNSSDNGSSFRLVLYVQ